MSTSSTNTNKNLPTDCIGTDYTASRLADPARIYAQTAVDAPMASSSSPPTDGEQSDTRRTSKNARGIAYWSSLTRHRSTQQGLGTETTSTKGTFQKMVTDPSRFECHEIGSLDPSRFECHEIGSLVQNKMQVAFRTSVRTSSRPTLFARTKTWGASTATSGTKHSTQTPNSLK